MKDNDWAGINPADYDSLDDLYRAVRVKMGVIKYRKGQRRFGHMTPTGYQEYLHSPEWKELRAKVLKRDNYQCVRCEETDDLTIHHKTYKRAGSEELDDLETLCYKCHVLHHVNGNSKPPAWDLDDIL